MQNNRRSFIKNTAYAGIGISALNFTSTAYAKKQGGTLRIAIEGASGTDTLDPRKLTVEFAKVSVEATLDGLLWVRHDGKLEKLVASEWSSNDAGTQWTFKIDPRARFTDGKKVTVEDVLYSFNLHRGKKSTSAAVKLLSSVSSLKAKGKDSIVFTLNEANYEFPVIVTDYHFKIVKNGETNWEKPIGTGQYVIDDFSVGIKTVVKRVNNDWGNRGSYVDTIEIIAVNDPNARTNGLLSNAFHIAGQLDFKIAKRVEQSSKHSVDITKAKTHYIFPMDTRTDTFKNVNIRKALKFGTDRQKLVDLILNGYGYVGNDHSISKNDPMFNHDLPQTNYDTDKAKYYLKKAGMPKLNITGYTSDAAYSGAVNAMSVLSESVRDAGITLKVQRAPADGYWSDVWMKKPFCTSYWGGRATALATLETEAASYASWNDAFWKNDTFDTLLKSAKASKDFSKRREYVMEAQALMSDDGGWITPMFAYDLNGVANTVKGMKKHAELSLRGRRLHETVWLDI